MSREVWGTTGCLLVSATRKDAMAVAIQGEVGSFSDEAARRLLGEEIEIRNCRHFDEVFRVTSEGIVEASVVPLENSLTGSIHRNYDLLRRYGLRIHRELYLTIIHNLIALPDVAFEDLEAVISHPVALGQCERFFERFPHLRVEPSHDTSGSVRELWERNLRNYGAIAGRRASEVFGGVVLMEGIQDSSNNYTRFVLLRTDSGEEVGNKTSLVFSFKSVPGALFKCLSVFALREIDLTKIESRPMPERPWEYLFYVDFLGNLREKRVRNALNHLGEIVEQMEVLGCYPRDESVRKTGI
jgi:prephenate dehydratase